MMAATSNDIRKLMSPTSVVVKFKFDNTIRRIPITQVPTLDELCFMAQRLFKSMLSANLDNLVLRYEDEDGDLVSIVDDSDISLAMSQYSVFKVTINDKETLPLTTSLEQLPLQLSKAQSNEVLNTVAMTLIDLQTRIGRVVEALKIMDGSASAGNGGGNTTATKPLSMEALEEFLPRQVSSDSLTDKPYIAKTADTTTAASAEDLSRHGSISSQHHMNNQIASPSTVVSTPTTMSPATQQQFQQQKHHLQQIQRMASLRQGQQGQQQQQQQHQVQQPPQVQQQLPPQQQQYQQHHPTQYRQMVPAQVQQTQPLPQQQLPQQPNQQYQTASASAPLQGQILIQQQQQSQQQLQLQQQQVVQQQQQQYPVQPQLTQQQRQVQHIQQQQAQLHQQQQQATQPGLSQSQQQPIYQQQYQSPTAGPIPQTPYMQQADGAVQQQQQQQLQNTPGQFQGQAQAQSSHQQQLHQQLQQQQQQQYLPSATVNRAY